MLSKSPAIVLRRYIVNSGLLEDGYSCFVGHSGDANCITITDTMGWKESKLAVGVEIFQYTVQLMFRQKVLDMVYVSSLLTDFEAVVNQEITIDGYMFLLGNIGLVSGPFSLGLDENRIEQVSVNLRLSIEEIL